MNVFLRCPCVNGRGTIKPRGCTHTWQYQFKEDFGGPALAKYGPVYATFRKVQQGDTKHTNRTPAVAHVAALRKDMRLIKSGDAPVGPLKVTAAMGDTTTTLATLVDQYAAWVVNNLAEATHAGAIRACRTFAGIVGADRVIHSIVPGDFETFKTTRKGEGRTLTYINTQLHYVQGMFRQAEILYPGFTSPFTPIVIAGKKQCPITGFTIKKTPKRAPTPAEYARLIAQLPDPCDVIAQTIFETSARVGEVVALKKGDIGLYPDGQAGWFQRELKGGDIHYSDISAALATKLLARLKGPDAVFFFPHHTTPFRHLRTNAAIMQLRRLFDAMGYDWMTSHRIRHMSIRSMLARRVPDIDIGKMTGWTEGSKQLAEYAGDRTHATRAIGRENATVHGQMMTMAPQDAPKVKPLYRKTKTTVLPFKQKGIA